MVRILLLNPLRELLFRGSSREAGQRLPKLEKGEELLRAEGIVKEFPGVWTHLILDHVTFDVRAGEIHSLLGENGAGKTVLANILSGFYMPSDGKIHVRGRHVSIGSPKDALRLGIGMAHQETTLVRPLTVAENITLGISESDLSYPLSKVERRIRELLLKYGLKVNPRARVEDLSAGEQQRVEIVKTLYNEPYVLILDEPTSVLTPQEAEELFSIVRSMAADGRGIVYITHKLEEVMELSDRVSVLRLGKLVVTKSTSKTTREELVKMMIGDVAMEGIARARAKRGEVVLELRDLYVSGAEGSPAVDGISIQVRGGEILGIAGVAGNGQRELVEAVTGIRRVETGRILIFGVDMTGRSPRAFADQGVSHIPEDRRRVGIAEGMSLAENLMMRDYRLSPFSKRGVIDRSLISQHAQRMVSDFEIMAPDLWDTETRILSGGNIQRLILARELWREPRLVIAAHPTYGLDLRAVQHTHALFSRLRLKGSAILLVSEDLEEVFAMSDRIAVMFRGKIVDVKGAEETSPEEIGLMMAGTQTEGTDAHSDRSDNL
ncbi:MAG: ABC transporter ATP-binding protein [Candidatus Geothermarchaeales archaeon]